MSDQGQPAAPEWPKRLRARRAGQIALRRWAEDNRRAREYLKHVQRLYAQDPTAQGLVEMRKAQAARLLLSTATTDLHAAREAARKSRERAARWRSVRPRR